VSQQHRGRTRRGERESEGWRPESEARPGGRRRRCQRRPRRKDPGAKAPETPRQVCMTTLSDGETDLPLGTNMEVVVGSKHQELRLLADDFLRDDVRERQNVLQPFQKT